MNEHTYVKCLQQPMDFSLSDDDFYRAELFANDAKKRVYDYENDPELDIPDKYKSFIWFALPKDIVSTDSNQLEDTCKHHLD